MRHAVILVFLAACPGGGSSSPGNVNGDCLPDDRCNNGLVCVEGKCTALDGKNVLVDANLVDAAFVCADDSTLEPNDSTSTAFVTPVDTQTQTLNLSGLSICPATDKDHYRVTVSTGNKGIEVIAQWTSGPALQLSLLNASGSAIVNASSMGANAVRACAPNLPTGTYFGAVFGTAQNNYLLSIKTVTGC